MADAPMRMELELPKLYDSEPATTVDQEPVSSEPTSEPTTSFDDLPDYMKNPGYIPPEPVETIVKSEPEPEPEPEPQKAGRITDPLPVAPPTYITGGGGVGGGEIPAPAGESDGGGSRLPLIAAIAAALFLLR